MQMLNQSAQIFEVKRDREIDAYVNIASPSPLSVLWGLLSGGELTIAITNELNVVSADVKTGKPKSTGLLQTANNNHKVRITSKSGEDATVAVLIMG